jgi:hypothetical protein
MSVETPDSITTPAQLESNKSGFIAKLGEYKEFLALLIFFLGGVFWIFAYFATKEQLKTVQCLMNSNFAVIQGKLDSSSLSQLLVQNLEDTAALDRKPNLTAAEAVKRKQLKTAANDISRRLTEADTATTKALNKLKSGDCIAETNSISAGQ